MPIAVLAMAMGAGLVGCGNNPVEEQSATQTASVKEEKIVVKAADNKTKVTVGDTVQLTSTIEGVTWESADTTIATVSETGLVTTLKAGKVKITAKKDGCKDGTIEITVELVKITLTAAGDKTTLVQGETVQSTLVSKLRAKKVIRVTKANRVSKVSKAKRATKATKAIRVSKVSKAFKAFRVLRAKPVQPVLMALHLQ